MLLYTFDVLFDWKALFKFLTSLSGTLLYRLGSAHFRQILREILIMSQKHSFASADVKTGKSTFQSVLYRLGSASFRQILRESPIYVSDINCS